ncbi:MAG TPA: hypothetical protein VMT88_04600 [Actinomycetes bacterium]|nr:hypothetical protein [Actinomycetes bacterium]
MFDSEAEPAEAAMLPTETAVIRDSTMSFANTSEVLDRFGRINVGPFYQ